MLGIFMSSLSSADFLQNLLFSKKSFRNTIIVLYRLDPDQARCVVRPDLGLNMLQLWLSADDISMQKVNSQVL